MTAPSPLSGSVGLVTFEIKTGGKTIPDTAQVLSIDTWVAANRIPRARIVLLDGAAGTADSGNQFPLAATDIFAPGKTVEIAAGYESTNKTIFKGVIVKLGLEIDRHESSRLVVEVAAKALVMTLQRKCALFEKITDSALIKKLIEANSGLSAKVAATSAENERVVQYDASDWDLMVMRAELNGLAVLVNDTEVAVAAPDAGQSAVLGVTYGVDMLDLDLEMDAASQVKKSAFKSYAWDPLQRQVIDGGAGSGSAVSSPGTPNSEKLAEVFGLAELARRTSAPVAKAALEDWSKAGLVKSSLAKVRGSVRFQGSALVVAGKTIELAGLGTRFNGTAWLSGVHHRIGEGAWLTTASFGLPPIWFAAETAAIVAPDAAGQAAPLKGLHAGIVKQVAKDETGAFRVLVKLPLLNAGEKGVWARLATFYASNGVGAVFFPEVDDEVVVGFMNEDPRFPVILGSVYGKNRGPAFPPDEKNEKKALTTRTKLQITFDEQDKIIEISTPGKQVVTLDDKAKAITLKDSNGNTVRLSDKGITLDSASDVAISAKGDVKIAATGNLKMSATSKASLNALEIAMSANTKFAAQGNATAEVTASGMLTLRGGLVKIN